MEWAIFQGHIKDNMFMEIGRGMVFSVKIMDRYMLEKLMEYQTGMECCWQTNFITLDIGDKAEHTEMAF